MDVTSSDTPGPIEAPLDENAVAAFISAILEEVDALRAQVVCDSAEISRIKSESATIRAEIRAILDRLEVAR